MVRKPRRRPKRKYEEVIVDDLSFWGTILGNIMQIFLVIISTYYCKLGLDLTKSMTNDITAMMLFIFVMITYLKLLCMVGTSTKLVWKHRKIERRVG